MAKRKTPPTNGPSPQDGSTPRQWKVISFVRTREQRQQARLIARELARIQNVEQPKPPAGPSPKGMTPSEIIKAITIGKRALNSAIDKAEVKRPKAGGHDQKYSSHHISRIARARAESSRCNRAERQRWDALLKKLGQPTLDKPLPAKRK